ncbi:MAG: gliding motility-associated C-terminal domain-containing protein [Cryomorphaceae bacterium]|nr:MAG: gliding motility-associated C-terminal domain-containing protein [Cryomorphaceae bacterium]
MVEPEGQIFVPNAFTPNEDGVNDLFEVKGHNIAEFEMVVMNRYGQVVFRTNSMDNKWNGSDISGRYYAQNEVYVYTIKARTTRDKLIEKQGTITVIR